jgi:hypothetical protein
MVRNLAAIAAVVLGLYLTLKIFDLAASGTWRHLYAGSWESWFYSLELILAAVIPMAILTFPRARRSPSAVALASASAVIGLLWNRLNVGIFGYFRDAGTLYVPSLTEWALCLGVIGAAGLAFFFAVENLPIFDTEWRRRRESRTTFTPAFDRVSRVWRTALGSGLNRASLIAVFIVPLGWLALYPPFYGEQRKPAQQVAPPIAEDAGRNVLRIDGNRSRMKVLFPHLKHQQRLGKEDSCVNCHHLSLPGDHSTPCSRCHGIMEGTTDIFRGDIHLTALVKRDKLQGWMPRNRTCALCHEGGKPNSEENAKSCMECHREDMRPTHELAGPHDMRWATGFRRAMHETCIRCHEKRHEQVRRPALPECGTCHEELRWREPTGFDLHLARSMP